jgi:hypothetical protein
VFVVTALRQTAEHKLYRSVLQLYSVYITTLCQTQASAAKCEDGWMLHCSSFGLSGIGDVTEFVSWIPGRDSNQGLFEFQTIFSNTSFASFACSDSLLPSVVSCFGVLSLQHSVVSCFGVLYVYFSVVSCFGVFPL